MPEGPPENMELWDSVCKTDPAITRHVSQRGGFTAICAQAQKKRATELWGAYGGKWKLKDLNWGTLYDGAGVGAKVAEITLDAVFEYPGGEFEVSSDILYKPGNDSRKKLRTDCLTKALSDLGFNSDVFEGKFDDNKYVAEMRKEFKGDAPAKPVPSAKARKSETPPARATDARAAYEAMNTDQRVTFREGQLTKAINEKHWDTLKKLYLRITEDRLLQQATEVQMDSLLKRMAAGWAMAPQDRLCDFRGSQLDHHFNDPDMVRSILTTVQEDPLTDAQKQTLTEIGNVHLGKTDASPF